MFGWEYPPHVYGGLATANFGISEGLHVQGDIETTLCLPHPFGDEDKTFANIVAMNCVPIVYRDIDDGYLRQRLGNIMDTDLYYKLRNNIYADFNNMNVNDIGAMEFAGGYPGNLTEEINNYSIIAGVVARTLDYDIIHAHDWLTFPAGIYAKKVSGKPLCIHIHATDFDRSGGKVNPTVYAIEKDGMDNADCIMCVSELTRQIVIKHYYQNPDKVFTVHNAVYPLRQDILDMPRPSHKGKDKVVTFLGRITMQKGPEYGIATYTKCTFLYGWLGRYDGPNDYAGCRTWYCRPFPLPWFHERRSGVRMSERFRCICYAFCKRTFWHFAIRSNAMWYTHHYI